MRLPVCRGWASKNCADDNAKLTLHLLRGLHPCNQKCLICDRVTSTQVVFDQLDSAGLIEGEHASVMNGQDPILQLIVIF